MILLFALLQDDAAVARAVIDQLDRAIVLYVEKHGAPPKVLDELKPILLTGEPPAATYTAGADEFTLEIAGVKRTTPLKNIGRRVWTDEERVATLVAAAVRAYHDLHGKLPANASALPGRGILVDAEQLGRVDIEAKSGGARITIAAKKLESPDEKAFAEQVRRLGGDDAAARDAAGKAIEAMGAGAIPAVDKAIAEIKDLEVTTRLRRIQEALRRRRAEGATVGYAFTQADLSTNERSAAAALKSCVTAQENFRSNDLDRNQVSDYWTGDIAGLYCIQSIATENAIAALNNIGVASADAARFTGGFENANVTYNADLLLEFWPCDGYLFRTITNDSLGTPYAQVTDGGEAVHNFGNFGAVAYPAEYGVTGRYTFIINEGASVFRRDTGGKPVENYPTAAKLSSEWEKVR